MLLVVCLFHWNFQSLCNIDKVFLIFIHQLIYEVNIFIYFINNTNSKLVGVINKSISSCTLLLYKSKGIKFSWWFYCCSIYFLSLFVWSSISSFILYFLILLQNIFIAFLARTWLFCQSLISIKSLKMNCFQAIKN